MATPSTLVPLGTLAEFVNGRSIRPHECAPARDAPETALPVIRIAQLSDLLEEGSPSHSWLDKVDRFIGDPPPVRHQVHDGDILFSWSTAVCVMRWSHGPAVLNQHIFRVVPRPGVDDRFLFHLLQELALHLRSHTQGTTLRHLCKSTLLGWSLALPSAGQQRVILELLNGLEHVVAINRHYLAQVQRVRQLGLHRLWSFPEVSGARRPSLIGPIPAGWTLSTLGALSTRITSGPRGWSARCLPPSTETPPGAHPFFRSQNIQPSRLDCTDLCWVMPPEGGESARAALCTGDLLFTITGDHVGHVARVPEQVTGYINQHIGLVRLADPAWSRFLALFFATDAPGQVQIRRLRQGQSRFALTVAQLHRMIVPLPPPGVRDAVVAQAQGLETLVQHSRSTLEAWQALQRVIRGHVLRDVVRPAGR